MSIPTPWSDTFTLPVGTVGPTLTPSPDSTRLAYAVQDQQGQYLEVNGISLRCSLNCNHVQRITFSPDSRTIAYGTERAGKWLLVHNECEYGQYDDIGISSPVISPDSSHFAY